MQLIRSELVNVCQYEQLFIDWRPGVTGILGRNGAGKSNLVNMLQASLTGDFSINPGGKDANIRRTADPRDLSYIKSQWRHEESLFTVTRNLRPAGQTLWIDGLLPLRKSAEIEAALTRLLGFSPATIADYLFVPQGRTFEFLSVDPATRKRAFMQLCGADRAETLWEQLGQQISQDQSLAAEVVDDRDHWRRQIAELESQRDGLKAEMDDRRSQVLSEEEWKELKAAVRRVQAASELRVQQRTAHAKMTSLTPQVAELREQLDAANQAVESQESAVAAARDEMTRVRDQLAAASQNRRIRQRRRELLQALEEKPPLRPAVPPGYAATAELTAELKTLEKACDKDNTSLQIFDRTGVVECPICKTPVGQLHEHLAELRVNVSEATTRIALIREVLPAYERYENQLAQYNRLAATYEANRSARQEELDQLPAETPGPEVDALLGQRLAARLSSQDAALQTARDEQQRIRDQWASINGQLEASTAEWESLTRQLAQLGDVPLSAAAWEKQLTDHGLAVEARRQLAARVQEADRQIATAQEYLQRTSDLLARSSAARNWLISLNRWRQIVHRDNLPRLVTQSALEDLTEHLNATLEVFQGPFRVSATEDLSFLIHHLDGKQEPAVRLSGGQKMILGIAYWLAVNSRFAGEIGMLVLDEPTAGVDEENIDCFGELLTRASEITRQRGQQLIIITHDRRLERVFDNVIEITKAT